MTAGPLNSKILYAYRTDYMSRATTQERQDIIAAILKHPMDRDTARLASYYFEFDPMAHIQLFHQELSLMLEHEYSRVLDMVKKHPDRLPFIDFFFQKDDILRGCREVRQLGVIWDLDKAAVLDEIVSSKPEYAPLFEAYTPILATAERDNIAYAAAFENVIQTIRSHPVLARVTVPITYGFDPETDEPTTSALYPVDGLRKIERLFNDILNIRYDGCNKNIISGHPVNIVLQYGEDKQEAYFDFSVQQKDYKLTPNDIKAIEEYIRGQLSDGLGEDMSQFSRLVGHDILTPNFSYDQLKLTVYPTITTPHIKMKP